MESICKRGGISLKFTFLEVISTRGEMTFEEFDRAFYALHSPNINNLHLLRRLAMRWLDFLGHCECDFEKRHIYVCEPLLVLLPGTGCKSAVLAGARSPEHIKRINEMKKGFESDLAIYIKSQDRDGITLPDVIKFEALEMHTLNQVAHIIKVNFTQIAPASWLLANASAGIAEYEGTFIYAPYYNLNWQCRTFNPEILHFEQGDNELLNPRLLEYTQPFTQQKIHWWILNGMSANIDRDWGRYVALRRANIKVILYDEKKQMFALPSFVPLPRILSRALTLCSGQVSKKLVLKNRLNDIPAGSVVDVYQGVPSNLAAIISGKIGQGCIPYNFILSEEGELL